MARYTATPSINGTLDINEVDADGIGKRLFFVGEAGPTYGNRKPLGEDAARVLVLALNLPGGIEAAIALLRAEVARQS